MHIIPYLFSNTWAHLRLTSLLVPFCYPKLLIALLLIARFKKMHSKVQIQFHFPCLCRERITSQTTITPHKLITIY